MNIIRQFPILVSAFLVPLNVLLMFFLIAILADGILKPKMGFIINSPLILILLVVIFLSIREYFKSQGVIQNLLKSVFVIFLGLINSILFIMNFLIWIDLFDGRTNAPLP